MCGLVGMAGALSQRDEEVMRRLLHFDYLRGIHSTGLGAIRGNGDVHIAKIASHPLNLFDTLRFRLALNGSTSVAFIGHNRQATVGQINEVNAHPFQYGNFIGAHNGTLDNWCRNDLEKELDERFPVDSMAIFAAMAAFGIEETVKKLQGSWALTFFDQSNGTINFIRNKERPLWLAYSKDGKHLFWASEWWMIQAATTGSDGKPYREMYVDKQGNQFFTIEPDILYTFSIDDLKKATDRVKPSAKKLEGKKSFLGQSGNNSWDPMGSRYQSDKEKNSNVVVPLPDKSNRPSLTTTSRRGSSSTLPAQVLVLEGDEKEPYAGRVGRTEFEALAQEGCSFCKEEIPWGTQGCSIYKRDDIILCPLCSSHQGKSTTTRIYVPHMHVVN